MRIGDMDPSPIKPPDPGQRPESSPASPARPEVSAPDQVELSRLSEVLRQAGVDEARIARLREAVQSGNYQVPAAEIAKKILDLHLE